MDNQSFITLSKFTVEARKVIGTVNPAKLIKDPAYSEAVFQKVEESAHEELIQLGLDLRIQLGLLDAENSEKNTGEPENSLGEVTVEGIAPVLPAEKYMFGARG